MKPLAERLRPERLDEVVGQKEVLEVLKKAAKSKKLSSFIFWGPPGCGKTTLAKCFSNEVDTKLYELSATSSGVKDVREVIEKAKNEKRLQLPTPILFIDEIHRFSKSQQDSLLKAVERGDVILIGATTENPSFEVNPPLLSRCQVYRMKHLTKEDLEEILARALKVLDVGVKEKNALFRYSGGDARKLLNILELLSDEDEITDELVSKTLQEKTLPYDREEDHYDTISAFIKSVRGSNPDAAIFYLATMLEGGEDPKFIARRLIILASEDIGLANSHGLLLANAAFDAVNKVGMPEARIILGHVTAYLAKSPKSNSAYKAINKAMSYVKKNPKFDIPLHLRNAPTDLMKELDYGKGYKYSHEEDDSEQEYLPEGVNEKFYEEKEEDE